MCERGDLHKKDAECGRTGRGLKRALTYRERAAEGEVAAAGELLVLVLAEDGAQRPIARDDADMQARIVHARPDDGYGPAYPRAVGGGEAVFQEDELHERHEQAGDVESLALDLADGFGHLLCSDAQRCDDLLSGLVLCELEEDDEQRGGQREQRDQFEEVRVRRQLMRLHHRHLWPLLHRCERRSKEEELCVQSQQRSARRR